MAYKITGNIGEEVDLSKLLFNPDEFMEKSENAGKFENPEPFAEPDENYILQLVRVSKAKWAKPGKNAANQQPVLKAWFNFKAIARPDGDESPDIGKEASAYVNILAFFGENSVLRKMFVALVSEEPNDVAKRFGGKANFEAALKSVVGHVCVGKVTNSMDEDGNPSRSWVEGFDKIPTRAYKKNQAAIEEALKAFGKLSEAEEEVPF